MRLKTAGLWIIGALAVIVGSALGFYYLLLDWQGRPFCHKQVMFAFTSWMGADGIDINSKTNAFPNANGVSQDSLGSIHDEMNGFMDWAKDYKYVPGLRGDDPGGLVLMYVNRPTRWTWHGAPPTVFKEKAWIVVPIDFAMGDRRPTGPGELSERVSTEEFKRRLTGTIDFVKTNARPHWQTIVAEHTKFLETVERGDR